METIGDVTVRVECCCGGAKRAGEVCRAKGLDEAQVIEEIERACAVPSDQTGFTEEQARALADAPGPAAG